jgi:hypothetical protein
VSEEALCLCPLPRVLMVDGQQTGHQSNPFPDSSKGSFCLVLWDEAGHDAWNEGLLGMVA